MVRAVADSDDDGDILSDSAGESPVVQRDAVAVVLRDEDGASSTGMHFFFSSCVSALVC